jgi:hypothetical protein
MLLFKTIHGSHLYGLSTPTSDLDTYQVIATKHRSKLRNAKHKINGQDDVMTVDFCTWMAMCEKSVPQALEAMFSERAEFDMIPEFRRSFVVSYSTLQDTYRRTVKNFSEDGHFKKNRHALRLCVNMWDAWEYGRFNPTLSTNMINLINSRLATEEFGVIIRDFLDGNF